MGDVVSIKNHDPERQHFYEVEVEHRETRIVYVRATSEEQAREKTLQRTHVSGFAAAKPDSWVVSHVRYLEEQPPV